MIEKRFYKNHSERFQLGEMLFSDENLLRVCVCVFLFSAASRKRWRGPWHRTAARPRVKSTATACTARTRRPVIKRPCRRRLTLPDNPTCRTRITRMDHRIPARACRSIRITPPATRSRRVTALWYRALVGNRSPLDISRIT